MSSPRPGTGLVIGKLYPLHQGHLELFRFGASQVEELWILICHSDARYSIPGALRKEWIERLAPSNARVLLINEVHGDDDSQGWAQDTIAHLGFVPEKVFTSESYGPTYCSHLGSKHVEFDPHRKLTPISGTAVRRDPWKAWDFLSGPVRAYYAARVVLVGAESTGKTTLSEALARAYGTHWVAEYGRAYQEKHRKWENEWIESDFIHIAEEQNRLEDEAAELANRVLFCDTNALCTSIWTQRYLGHRSARVDKIAEGRHYDLILFCEPDFAFVQDGTRDGEHIREDMSGWFKDHLRALGLASLTLMGDHESRLETARAAIDPLLARGSPRAKT